MEEKEERDGEEREERSEKRSKRSPKLTKLLLPLAVLVVLAGAAYYFKWIFVAAMVGNKPITHLQLVKELEAQGGKSVLDSIVDKELINAEANKYNVSVSEGQVADEIKKIEEQLKPQGVTLDAALASRGQTKASLEEQIRVQKTVEALLTPRIKITDEEIQKYFDDNKTVFGKDAKLETVKDHIQKQLFNDRLTTEYQTWMEELRKNGKVQYFLKF